MLVCLVVIIGCVSESYQNTKKETIYLYRRDTLGGDSTNTFIDYLVISNNSKKAITVKRLYDYAKNYCDTTKGNLPVSSVTFIKNDLGRKIPSPYDYDKLKKYFLYSFSFFKHGIYKNEMSLIIWKNGENKLLFSFTEDGRKEIAYLMNQIAL